jgi:hypothetical protein
VVKVATRERRGENRNVKPDVEKMIHQNDELRYCNIERIDYKFQGVDIEFRYQAIRNNILKLPRSPGRSLHGRSAMMHKRERENKKPTAM